MNDAFLRRAEEGLKILTIADVMGQMDSALQPFSFAFLKEKTRVGSIPTEQCRIKRLLDSSRLPPSQIKSASNLEPIPM